MIPFQEKKYESLAELRQEALGCQNCHLRSGCRGVVFGEGNPDALLMIVGEGPGATEDEQGKPFVGKAGQLLTRMLAAIGLSRDEVYITNVVKCRPENNRTPTMDEMMTCIPILRRQYQLIRPKIMVLLGSAATRAIISPDAKITEVRGKWVERQGLSIMPTYHPAFLLRNPAKKEEAWEDLQEIRRRYDALRSTQLFPG